MLDLIKFELYKIFSKKSVIIVLLLTVLFSAFGAVGESIYLKFKGLDSIDDAYNIMKQYEGQVITQEGLDKANKTVEDIIKKEKSGKKLTKEELVYKQYLFDGLVNDAVFQVNNEYYTLSEMKNEMSNMEKNGGIETYKYKNLKYVYDKVKDVEEGKYYFNHGWIITTNFKIIATLISILIVVGLASIFSDDYQSNSAQIILSCRRGKNKLVLSKIIAGLTFTMIVFFIINSIFLISALSYDFIGWDKPLELFKYYRATPFDMRVIDFYIVGLCISFMGEILFALATMLISLVVKNNMISLLVSLTMYYAPTFIVQVVPIDTVSGFLNEINIERVMGVERMFANPNTYNILGNPVLYPTVLISLVIIFIPIVIYLINYLGERQTV